MHINRSNLILLNTGFQLDFNNGALGNAQAIYDRYTMNVPSSKSQEMYPWLGTFPGMREWVGERVIQNIRTYDFTIRNKPFESTVEVHRDNIEDDSYGIYTPMMQTMGEAAAIHPQELIDLGLIAQGFTALCYDGQPFFSQNHPTFNADGTTTLVSNSQGGAGTPWYLLDASRAVKPFILQTRKKPEFVARTSPDNDATFQRAVYQYGVDWRGAAGYGLWQLAYASRQPLNEANYEAARAAMRSITGDNGRKLAVKPNLLLVPATLEGTANRLVAAETGAAGATNVNNKSATVLVSPWL